MKILISDTGRSIGHEPASDVMTIIDTGAVKGRDDDPLCRHPDDLELEMFYDSPGARTLDIKIARWLKQWADSEVHEGRSIKELLRFRDSSLWWFGETSIFRERFGDIRPLREILTRLEALDYFFEKHKPESVIIEGGKSLTSRCAVLIAKKNNIPTQSGNDTFHNVDESFPKKVIRYKLTRQRIRSILAWMHRGHYSKPAEGCVFLLSYYSNFSRSGKNAAHDKIFSSIIDKTGESGYGLIPIYVDRRYPIGYSSFTSLKGWGIPMDIISRRRAGTCDEYLTRLGSLWSELKRSESFHNSFRYEGIDIWPLLGNYFAFLFIKQFPEAVRQIEVSEDLLKWGRPKAVVIHNETGFYGRAMIMACRKLGVRSIGLQHGNIGESQVEYVHAGSSDALPPPIPDVTAIWSRWDMDLLARDGFYTMDNLFITGVPRFDRLAFPEAHFNKERLRGKFNILPADRLIAVITQPFFSHDEGKAWLTAVIGGIKGLKGARVIVKPHPAESEKMAEEVIHSLNANIAMVSKKVDIHELLYAADLSVTYYSTAGLESLILGTPLVTVNLSGQSDEIPYAEEKAAMGVYNAEQIGPVINDLLVNGVSDEIADGMKSYVERHAHRIDGQSSARTIQLIKKVINNG